MPERDWQRDWELCEKATPGPWGTRVTHNMSPSGSKVSSCEIVALEPGEIYPSKESYCIAKLVPYGAWAYGEFKEHVVRDAQFIAEARQALPYWLQRVRELEAKWLVETEDKIRLRYNKTQLEAENANLRRRLEKLEAVAEAARRYFADCNHNG